MRHNTSFWLSVPIALAALAPLAVLVWLGFSAELEFSGRTAEILLNTILLTGLTVLTSILVGVPLAFVMAYADLPGRRFWLAALAAPLAMPSYIGAFAYFAAFGGGGELETLLGIATPRLEGLPGAVLVMTLYTFPFVMLTTRASLRNLDPSMVDAARVLGLSLPQAMRRVVLPRARGGIAAGALIVALYTLSDFGTPAIMRLDTFTRMIYVEYNAFGLERAALLSVYLLALVAVVLWLESRVSAERERPGRTLNLYVKPGHLILLVAIVLSILMAALGLPLGMFTVWLLREGAAGFDPAYAWNSVHASLLAAIAAVIVALPVAYATTAGRAGRLLERATHFGFGVPGIVLGTALVYIGLQLDMLYQTLALLVLGYVLRFLSLAVGSIRSRAERIDRNLVAAARSLGASPAEAFRRVSLPLALPGIAAGAALVFLEAMRELPATLMLQPTGFDTLATYLWRVYEAGYLGYGAIPGLLLVLVSMVALVVLLSGEERASL